jgi:hypothetical protein
MPKAKATTIRSRRLPKLRVVGSTAFDTGHAVVLEFHPHHTARSWIFEVLPFAEFDELSAGLQLKRDERQFLPGLGWLIRWRVSSPFFF